MAASKAAPPRNRLRASSMEMTVAEGRGLRGRTRAFELTPTAPGDTVAALITSTSSNRQTSHKLS